VKSNFHPGGFQLIDPAIVLFANDAFYLAFNNRDIVAMDQLWSRHTQPVCIHPGWDGLFSRDEIIQSWRDIFDNDNAQSSINCHQPRVLFQRDIISVVCYEELSQGWLVATNSFVMEDELPKIFHHQASQCMNAPDISESEKPTLQ
jgi:hypothetical protein